MAITALTAVGGITATFTLTDFTNRSVTAQGLMPAATTLANAQALALAIAQALEPLTDCKVSAVNIGVRYTTTGADAAVQGNYAEDKGVFSIQTAAGKVVRFAVPGFKNSKLLGTTRSIDLADTDVAALTTLLITGDGTTAPVDSNGSDLASVISAKIRQRSEVQAD